MREIEFRGKRIDNGEWAHGYLIEFWTPKGQKQKYAIDTCQEYTWNEDSLGVYEIIPETVGQFTGLLDKNGKKIYEGDIILHTTTRGVRGMYPKPTNRVATIVYSSDFCRFGLDYVEQGVDMGEMMEGRVKEYEILGNIYDNPELLKEEGKNV